MDLEMETCCFCYKMFKKRTSGLFKQKIAHHKDILDGETLMFEKEPFISNSRTKLRSQSVDGHVKESETSSGHRSRRDFSDGSTSVRRRIHSVNSRTSTENNDEIHVFITPSEKTFMKTKKTTDYLYGHINPGVASSITVAVHNLLDQHDRYNMIELTTYLQDCHPDVLQEIGEVIVLSAGAAAWHVAKKFYSREKYIHFSNTSHQEMVDQVSNSMLRWFSGFSNSRNLMKSWNVNPEKKTGKNLIGNVKPMTTLPVIRSTLSEETVIPSDRNLVNATSNVTKQLLTMPLVDSSDSVMTLCGPADTELDSSMITDSIVSRVGPTASTSQCSVDVEITQATLQCYDDAESNSLIYQHCADTEHTVTTLQYHVEVNHRCSTENEHISSMLQNLDNTANILSVQVSSDEQDTAAKDSESTSRLRCYSDAACRKVES